MFKCFMKTVWFWKKQITIGGRKKKKGKNLLGGSFHGKSKPEFSSWNESINFYFNFLLNCEKNEIFWKSREQNNCFNNISQKL